MSDLIFYVNGIKITETNPSPNALLANYLRYNLNLTGTKVSCGEGGCGSCTVMVSWFDRSTSKIVHNAVNACILPICLLHGLAITTVEALGSTRTKLHQLQERIVSGHGIQCGFCTPGMVMAMYALLRSNSAPTELQIEHALQGNLCRCTGYRPILDSFRSLSKASECSLGGLCCRNQSKENSCAKAVCCFAADDSSKQELIFPSELQLSDCYDKQSLKFVSDSVTWYRPVSMKELLGLKKQFPDALLVSGGTNAVFHLKYSIPEKPLVVIAMTQISELRSFEERDGGMFIGAMTSMTSLENRITLLLEKLPETKSRFLSSLLDVLQYFGYPPIRNRATIGGGLATANAVADVNVLLLTTGSRIKLASATREREVDIRQSFFTGKSSTCLKPEEVILGLFLPFSSANEYFESFKQSARKDLASADVNAGMHVEFEGGSNVVKVVDLVFGGFSTMPVIAQETAKKLIGRKWTGCLLDELTSSLADELRPMLSSGDSDKYKLAVAQGFAFKFFLKVYNKHYQNLDFMSLTEEEEHYLTSTQLAVQQTHSGTQVYDIVSKQSEADAVGQPLTHRWAKQSATGEAVFIDDMRPSQGELYLTLVTSTKASAKIVSIDPSAALAMKGVVCFLDHTSVIKSNLVGKRNAEEEIFACDEVHWVGQTIGAIVAESHDLARRAARAVIVQYEEYEPIITIEDAISKKSFHPWEGEHGVINYGDVKAAFASCDHVIEGEVRVGGQEHFYMETHSVRVVPKGEDGELDIFVGAQFSTELQIYVASALDVAFNKIVIHTKKMGGAFGGKECRAFLVSVPTAIAAHKLNRPVRCVLERHQDMQITGIRRPYLAKYKVGFNKDGKIQALDLDYYSNDGFWPEISHICMGQSMFYADNCYAIPNISVRGQLCKTNLPPNTPMRGAGVPQSILICEHWMTKVSEFLKQPPHKIRQLNLYREGDVTFINVPVEGSLRRCFEEVLKQSDYQHASEEIEKFNSKSVLLKRGIAILPVKLSPFLPSAWFQAGALVNVYLDGSVLLYHGGVESGQGLHTKMIQVASRALDIPVDKIHLSETSSGVIPNSTITGGSVGADLNGAAILDACNKLNERLKLIKEANPSGEWDEWIKAAHGQKINLSASGYHCRSYNEDYDWKTGKGRPYGYYTYGAVVTQVEIDCLTGSYTIPTVDIVMDVGKSLNPAIDVGQIEGAFVMGIGMYALEEHRYGPDGHLQTIGAGKYHIPTAGSIPLQMNVSLLKDAGNPMAVYSSKGIGEPPLLLSCSVFFAIHAAISAARQDAGLPLEFVLDSPATVQKIRLACGTDAPKIKPSG